MQVTSAAGPTPANDAEQHKLILHFVVQIQQLERGMHLGSSELCQCEPFRVDQFEEHKSGCQRWGW